MPLFASTFHWLRRKRYQYEVTFSLYMLTPTEKFIFNSFLFLFFSMIIIAMTLYLPQNVSLLANRALFYYQGDEQTKSYPLPDTSTPVNHPHTHATSALVETITETVMRSMTTHMASNHDGSHHGEL